MIPTPIIRTRGYMAILWYQQRTQGVKPKISPKYKLPAIETTAVIQAIYKILSLISLVILVTLHIIHFLTIFSRNRINIVWHSSLAAVLDQFSFLLDDNILVPLGSAILLSAIQ